MRSLDYDAMIDAALTLLRAAAEKNAWLAPLAEKYESRVSWRFEAPERKMDALFLLACHQAALAAGVKLASLDLPALVPAPPAPEPERPAPAGPPSGSAFDEHYVDQWRRRKIRTPIQISRAAQLGRPLTAEEHAAAVAEDKERYGNPTAAEQRRDGEPSSAHNRKMWGVLESKRSDPK